MIIKSYTNSKQELNLLSSRLKLIEKRKEIVLKEKENIQSLIQNNKICELIEKLKIEQIELDNAYKNLEREQEELNSLSETIKSNIKFMEENLQLLTGVEYQLYYQIVVKGLNVTKAIDKVAFDQNLDSSTLWKYYYPKIKDKIDLSKKKTSN